MIYTDKDLIDFLEKQNNKARYTGKCIFRVSSYGRGWRFHETSQIGSQVSVREALYDAIKKEEE